MTGMFSPKVDTSASELASRKAAEDEAKSKIAEDQRKSAEEYRRVNQMGRAATVLSTPMLPSPRETLGG